MRRARRRAAFVTALSLACVLSACGTQSPVDSAAALPGVPACADQPTPSCGVYTYSNPRAGTVVVVAPASAAPNTREFFWSPTGPTRPDLTVCATFVDGGGLDQQGIVLRLHRLSDGRMSAISVTRNVWLSAFDVFNFHVWNTGSDPNGSLTQFASSTVPWLPVAPALYPLHMCARTLEATNTVQFVVWTAGQTRPEWGSAGHGGQATIPPGAPASGRGGWFAGHLRPGTRMTYGDLTVDGKVPRGLS